MRLIFNSRRPTPFASYQCNSAIANPAFASRILANPFNFRQRVPPYRFRSRDSSRSERPVAIVCTA